MSLALSVVDMPTLLLLLLLHCSKYKYYGLPVMMQIPKIPNFSKAKSSQKTERKKDTAFKDNKDKRRRRTTTN
jgi:hypothetical protein